MKLIKKYLDLGAYFTIGVEVLQSKKIQTLAKELPVDRILTEMDNPSVWNWLNGEKGFPELICHVESKIAEIRETSKEKLSKIIAANFRQVLKADDIWV